MHDADTGSDGPSPDPNELDFTAFAELESQLRDALTPPPLDELAEARDAAFRRELREVEPHPASREGLSLLPLIGLAAALLLGCFFALQSFKGNAEKETLSVAKGKTASEWEPAVSGPALAATLTEPATTSTEPATTSTEPATTSTAPTITLPASAPAAVSAPAGVPASADTLPAPAMALADSSQDLDSSRVRYTSDASDAAPGEASEVATDEASDVVDAFLLAKQQGAATDEVEALLARIVVVN